jgi:hypothetical protein
MGIRTARRWGLLAALAALALLPAAADAAGTGFVVLHAGMGDARPSAVRSEMRGLGFSPYQANNALALESYAFRDAELWPSDGEVSVCPEGKPMVDLAARVAEAQAAIDGWDYERAAARLVALFDDLACVAFPADAATLARTAVMLGYARFEAGDAEGAKQAFRHAAAFDPAVTWDDRFPPDAGRIFAEAVDDSLRATEARVQVLDAYRLHPEIRLDGDTFPGDGAVTPGLHRITVLDLSGQEMALAIRLDPGQTMSLVPVAGLVDQAMGDGPGVAVIGALTEAMTWTGAADAYIAVPGRDRVVRFSTDTSDLRVVPGPPDGATVATAPRPDPPVTRDAREQGPREVAPLDPVRRQRIAGGVVLGIGGATAAVGFITHASMYRMGLVETDPARYEFERNTNVAGFAIGVAGAITAAGGILLIVEPSLRTSSVALRPGPVSTLQVRF